MQLCDQRHWNLTWDLILWSSGLIILTQTVQLSHSCPLILCLIFPSDFNQSYMKIFLKQWGLISKYQATSKPQVKINIHKCTADCGVTKTEPFVPGNHHGGGPSPALRQTSLFDFPSPVCIELERCMFWRKQCKWGKPGHNQSRDTTGVCLKVVTK